MRFRTFIGLMILCLSSGLKPLQADKSVRNVRFGRDILPVLSENCFSCHGPDATNRKAELRLDTPEGAAVVLNVEHPEQSSLIARVTSTDPEQLMPPAGSKRHPLSADQISILKQWIADGAPWGRHWSFEIPVKVELPAGETHPVDAFVSETLADRGLTFSPPAPPHTLARRLSLDLTGLPPLPEVVSAFERDPSGDAVGRFADQLLTSEHYGERMAMWWLDAARYADTDGFQGDATRTNWPWRDWVVSAFNRNMPYDQFTREQFAGDLLPEATPEQRLATCFHRNHMTNGEGGRDPEESRTDYVIDRVSSMGTVWLGMTLGCCQCHSHKFDPVSQHDFYSLTAFFNSIDESGKAGREAQPYLNWTSPFVDRAVAETQQLVDKRKQIQEDARAASDAPFRSWLDEQIVQILSNEGQKPVWRILTDVRTEATEGTRLLEEADGVFQATGPNPRQDDYRVIGNVHLNRITGIRLEVLPHESHTGGSYSRGRGGHFVLTDIKVQVRRSGSSQVRDILVSSAVADLADDPKKYDGYGNIQHVLDDDPRNGWSTRDGDSRTPRTAVFALAEPLVLADDETLVFELRHRSTAGDASIGRFRLTVTDQVGPVLQQVTTPPLEQLAVALKANAGRANAADQAILLESAASDLEEPLKTLLKEQFLADYAPYQSARRALDRVTRQLDEINSSRSVDVMVLAERSEPRPTHVLVRGVWDKKGDAVRAALPAALTISDQTNNQAQPVVNGGVPLSRLDLANWLTSNNNPLTARVVVNHIWQMLFGTGLVRTAEDFGLQGERPSHPELLDWLAVDLMENQWDIKSLIRLIVTSRTYQQSSTVTEQLRAVDPENRLLSRGARFRLPAWMLRDSALQVSGLLNTAVGGPPVRPWQPEGVWEEMFMGRFRYDPSEGPAQYRRTLYAFWRRAIAPTFLFDSAQRRVCEVRTARTNTPLHALTLLNDATSLEASRALAEKAVQTGIGIDEQLDDICLRVLSRRIATAEKDVLIREYQRALEWYRQHPDSAVQLLQSTGPEGRFPELSFPNDDAGRQVESNSDVCATAALLLTASTVLNLDEAMTHE